ncbi:MAG: TrmH family RNA methyltransferase [Candidatus Puniceispirillaceae bacterium]
MSYRPPHDDVITSAGNTEIKRLRSLHERKYRRKEGMFLAEGVRIVTEACQLGHLPSRLVITSGRTADRGVAPLIDACMGAGGRVLTVTEALMTRISKKDNPQTVLGAFASFAESVEAIRTEQVAPDSGQIWIALDRVRDPGNLGTIMRTADAVGAEGVILIDDCTDPFSVEACRASMGAIFNLRIISTTTKGFATLADRWSGQIIGTALPASVDFRQADWKRPLILLMGNEQQGLTDELAALATQLVRLEMHGRSDSLNLAVATAICLYEALR